MPTRRLITIAGATLCTAPFAWAQQASVGDDALAKAAPFIRSAGNRLTALVQDASSAAEKHRRLRSFLDEVADVDGVARFCLGRFWEAATPAQQRDYLRLFHDVLTDSVAARVGDYPQGQSQVIIGEAVRKGDTIEVPTVVTRPTHDTQARVTWVLGTNTGALRIIDVVAEGVSLRLTQRSDYVAFLTRNNNDIGSLLRALRQQIAAN
ncbi:MAG TPA: ABC transporter substrate-binding protein [Acetobacteraceae bacterium]|nr:ABC transporter substrate-binding protein [Acetobacteraceae bacterium]